MWGARIDPRLKDRVEIITIATGVKSQHIMGKERDRDADDVSIYSQDIYDLKIRSI